MWPPSRSRERQGCGGANGGLWASRRAAQDAQRRPPGRGAGCRRSPRSRPSASSRREARRALRRESAVRGAPRRPLASRRAPRLRPVTCVLRPRLRLSGRGLVPGVPVSARAAPGCPVGCGFARREGEQLPRPRRGRAALRRLEEAQAEEGGQARVRGRARRGRAPGGRGRPSLQRDDLLQSQHGAGRQQRSGPSGPLAALGLGRAALRRRIGARGLCARLLAASRVALPPRLLLRVPLPLLLLAPSPLLLLKALLRLPLVPLRRWGDTWELSADCDRTYPGARTPDLPLTRYLRN